MMKTITITTAVDAAVCFGAGHVTFFSSAFAALKNCITFCIINLIFSIFQILQQKGKLAGQEGLEPPASGFGVRRSIH